MNILIRLQSIDRRVVYSCLLVVMVASFFVRD